MTDDMETDRPAMGSRSEPKRYRAGQPALELFLLVLRKATDLYYGLVYAAGFAVKERHWAYAVKSLRSIADRPTPWKIRTDRAFYRRVKQVHRARQRAPTRWITKRIFTAVAEPAKIIWVRPHDIRHKTPYDLSLYFNDILPGDWDLRRVPLERTMKYRSLVQRFRDGLDWEDTDIFKEKYRRALERRGPVRGASTVAELKGYYEDTYGRLYDGIKKDGFLVTTDEYGNVEIPHVHITRDGVMLFGNDGNHRLAMAKVLGIDRMPCFVRARHLEWQQLRDTVAAYGPVDCWRVVDPGFATHPDLADLLTDAQPGYRPLQAAVRACARAADRIIATDHVLVPSVLRHLRVADDRVRVVPNAIDLEVCDGRVDVSANQACRQRLGLSANDVVLLSVGRIEANKGFGTLVEALSHLAADAGTASLLGERWRWVLIGEGPHRADVERALEARGLRRHTWLPGHLDEAEVHAWYETATLFVHPTLYEGSSIVTLEAMAHRRAVVATTAGGLSDKVHPGVNGWLVAPGDVQALADAVAQALALRDQLPAFGDAGRAIVEREFAWPAVAARLHEVYEEVLTEWRRC